MHGRVIICGWILALSAGLGVAAASAQEMPEIREVRVPRGRTTSFFPAGAELRVMPREEWDATLRSVRAAVEKAQVEQAPRLRSVRHFARWHDGRLLGTTRLEATVRGAMPAALEINPWSMAITSDIPAGSLRNRADGVLFAWLTEPNAQTIAIGWEASASSDSDGRVFLLELPEALISTFELELPAHLEPSSTVGACVEAQSSAGDDSRLWRIERCSGRFLLGLRDRSDARSRFPLVTIDTQVAIEADRTSWTGTVSVSCDGSAPTRIQATLDPGLQFLDLSGEDVSHHAAHAGAAGETVLEVDLRGGRSASSSFQVRALAASPGSGSGSWSIPAMRVSEARWYPGRTRLVADQSVRVDVAGGGAGRLVAPTPTELNSLGPDQTMMVFASDSQGSAATVSTRVPDADHAVALEGQLRIDPVSVTLNATIRSRFERAGQPSLVLELPRAWVVDSVQILGLDETTSWSVEPAVAGRYRLNVLLPNYLDTRVPVNIAIRGASSQPFTREIESPRISVPGARMHAEAWLASFDPTLRIERLDASGVTWIDSSAPTARRNPREVAGGADRRQELAWRATADPNHVRFAWRHESETSARGEVFTLVRADRAKAAAEWVFLVPWDDDTPPRVLLPEGADARAFTWTFWNEDRWLPLAIDRAADVGEGAGSAWEPKPEHAPRPRQTFVFRATAATRDDAEFELPRLKLAGTSLASDTIIGFGAEGVWPTLESDGASESLAAEDALHFKQAMAVFGAEILGDWSDERPRCAMKWNRFPSTARLRVQRGDRVDPRSYIREANLLTRFLQGNDRHDRLELQLVATSMDDLVVTLPRGGKGLSARWSDGSPANAQAMNFEQFAITVPATRGTRDLIVEYTVGTQAAGSQEKPAREIPEFSWPCLTSRRSYHASGRATTLSISGTSGARPWLMPERLNDALSSSYLKKSANELSGKMRVGGFAAEAGPVITRASARVAMCLGVGFATAVVLTWSRRRSALGFALLGGLGVAGFGLAATLAPGAWGDAWFGIVLGIATCLALRERRVGDPGPAVPSERSRASLVLGFALAILIGLGLVMARAVARIPQDTPKDGAIVAVVPYDGVPNPEERGGRVVVLLEDYERLLGLRKDAEAAVSARNTQGAEGLGAVAARHGLVHEGALDRFESTYEIVKTAAGPQVWTLPLAGGVRTQVEIDGRDTALEVTAEGTRGLVVLERAGRISLHVRQWIPRPLRGEPHRLPVSRVARTQAAATLVSDSEGAKDEVGTEAIGPVDAIPAVEAGAASRRAAVASGLLRWHTQPAGDHGQLRVTIDSNAVLDCYRFETDEAWHVTAVPAASGPILVTSRREAGRIHWRVDFAKALSQGDSFGIELFRPMDNVRPGEASRRVMPNFSDGTLEIQKLVVAVVPLTGETIGSRQALDAEGRERARGEFEKAWGVGWDLDFPAVTFLQAEPEAEIAIEASPLVRQFSVQPSVELGVEASGIAFKSTTRLELGPLSRLEPIEVVIPRALSISSVDSEALQSWDRVAPDRLRLDFSVQAATAGRPEVVLTGWIPIPEGGTLEIPWVTWPGARTQPGELSVVGEPGLSVNVENRPEIRRVAEGATPGAAKGSAVFAVPPGIALGRLIVGVPAPRAQVSVQSVLRVFPSDVDWQALVRYQVLNGPCREIRFELPAEWAELVDVQALDTPASIQLTQEDGRFLVTLRPKSEAWGEQRVVVHGNRRHGGLSVAFPNLIPLGLGQVDTYLAWSNESGRALSAAGTAGVQEVEAARFDRAVLGGRNPARLRVYHVMRGGWSLQILGTTDAAERGNLALVDVACSVGEDFGVIGQTRCVFGSPATQPLALRLPDDVEVLCIEQGGEVFPYFSLAGQALALVDVAPSADRPLVVTWRRRDPPDPIGRTAELRFPAPVESKAPLLLTIRASAGDRASFKAEGLVESSTQALEYERLRVLTNQIFESVATFDRRSSLQSSDLAALLSEFEARHDRLPRGRSAPDAADQIGSLYAQIDDALAAAGLEELRRGPRQLRSGPHQALPSDWMEPIGAARCFVKGPAESAGVVAASLSPNPTRGAWFRAGIWVWPTTCFMLALLGLGTRHRGRFTRGMLGVAGCLVALMAAPFPSLALLPAAALVQGGRVAKSEVAS